MKRKPLAGTRVRFSGTFLRNTGQYLGNSGSGRWTVLECTCEMCGTGHHIAVNEPLDTSTGYEDQTEEWRENAKRHIAFANLENCK